MFASRIDDDLQLRLLEECHAQELFGMIDRDREDLRTWLPWVDSSRSAGDIAAFIGSARQKLATGTGLTCGIWHRRRLAGVIELRVDPAHRAGEIGYWLAREARGKGSMTRATRALVDHGFADLGLHRIVLRAATGNRASRAIAERLGFTLEGTLREAEWVNDHFEDLAVYAVLRREWHQDARHIGDATARR
jgi:ribosomal-protein-serine acetyltransferase